MIRLLFIITLFVVASYQAKASSTNINSNGIQCHKTSSQYVCYVTNNTVTVPIRPVNLYNGNYKYSDSELHALMMGNFFMAGRLQEQRNDFNNTNNQYNNGRYNNNQYNNGQQVDVQQLIGLLFNR